MSRLTVVIPYFKRRFLAEALTSLAAQTCRDFSVFVGDDCSPEDPAGVLATFRGLPGLSYHRFAQNLGGQSAVQQWNRCIRETNSEWVWLFSDDDVMAPDCVEAFYRTLHDTREAFDVYRFQSSRIDEEGRELRRNPANPEIETAAELALCRLVGTREFYVQDHIFSRRSFDREGGLVDLPCGLFSDDASWAAFARDTGVRNIGGGRLFWRQSGINLNAQRPDLVDQKLMAFTRYVAWVKRRFPSEPEEFHRKLRGGAAAWINGALPYLGGAPSWSARLQFLAFMLSFVPERWFTVLKRSTYVWRELARNRPVA